MDLLVIFLAIAVVTLTLSIASVYDQQTETLYNRSEQLRKIGGAIILILLIVTFLRSGDLFLTLVALGGIALATIYWTVERPDKQLV